MEKIGFQLTRRIMPLFEQIPYHNQFLYDIPTVTICIYIYTYILYNIYIYTYVCVWLTAHWLTRVMYIYIYYMYV